MPNVALTNLTAGELSPIMLGRPDVARYVNGCVRLENMVITATGMYSMRPGNNVMGLPKNATGPVRLRRFQFSDEQGYMLEIGVHYFRVYHTLGMVLDASTLAPVDVATPFEGDELPVLGFCQSADFLFVISERRGILAIKRRAHDSWSIEVFQLQDGPYGKVNVDAGKTLQLAIDAGSPVVGVTAAGFGSDPPFGAGDEGRLIRIGDSGAPGGWRWMIIQTVTDSTHVTAVVQDIAPTVGLELDSTPTSQWRLGIYSDRLGWPACGTLHQQRFVLAGPASIPDRIDGSAIADYPNFQPTAPLVENGAYAYTLGSKYVDRILALASADDLVAFTVGSEHRVSGDSTGSAITPSAIWQMPISPDGCKRIEPVQVGNALGFVDRYGLNIRSLTYDMRFRNYAPENLTLLADHMAWLDPDSTGFQTLAYQGNPFGMLWTIRGNGELAGAIYDPKEAVLGWHRHPQGSAAGETPVIESLDTMTGPTYDELWMVVRRDLPGRTLKTIERMGRPGLWDTPPERQCFLDCSKLLRNVPSASLTPDAVEGTAVRFTVSGLVAPFAGFVATDVGQFLKRRYVKGRNLRNRPIYATAIARIVQLVSPTEVLADILVAFPTTATMPAGVWGLTVSSVSGLDYLEGLQVTAMSDGRVCTPKTVVGGRIALDVPGWEISAGLRYAGYMVSMPLDPGPSAVVGQGRDVRVPGVRLRVLNSIGGEFASVPETDEEVPRWELIQPYSQGQAAPSAMPMSISGVRKVWGAGEWTREGQVAIRQTEPLPLNVQLMVTHLYAPFVQP